MNIRIQNLLRFLRLKNWTIAEHPNPRILVADSPKTENGDYASVVLPRDLSFVDAPKRIDEAITLLAGYFSTSVEELAGRIEAWDKDVLRTRLFHRTIQAEAIPLGLATLVMDDLRAFLGYAAYAQQGPKRSFPKAGGVAADFTAQCLFGHTFRGSFGLRIECPLPSVAQLAFSEQLVDPPFERLVMQRAAHGCDTIRVAVEKNDPNLLVSDFEQGLNANMLRALTDVYEHLDQLSIEYSFDWSPELTLPAALVAGKPLTFDSRAYEVAKFAADELEKEPDEAKTVIVSYVISLKSEMPLGDGVQDEFEHVITLDWEKERGVFIRLRVALPTGEYRKACDAHKMGKKIQVTGVPKKEGKFWVLTQPSEILFTV